MNVRNNIKSIRIVTKSSFISGKIFQMATAIIIAQGHAWRLLRFRQVHAPHMSYRQYKRIAWFCHVMVIHYIVTVRLLFSISFLTCLLIAIDEYSRIDFQEMSTYILRKSVLDVFNSFNTFSAFEPWVRLMHGEHEYFSTFRNKQLGVLHFNFHIRCLTQCVPVCLCMWVTV